MSGSAALHSFGVIGREAVQVVAAVMDAVRRELFRQVELVLEECVPVRRRRNHLNAAVAVHVNARVHVEDGAVDGNRVAPRVRGNVAHHAHHGLGDDAEQVVHQFEVLDQVEEDLLAAQEQARIEHAVDVEVADHVAVLFLERVHIGDPLLHGPGSLDVRDVQRQDLLAGPRAGHRPGRLVGGESYFHAEQRRYQESAGYVLGPDDGARPRVRLAEPETLIHRPAHGDVVGDAEVVAYHTPRRDEYSAVM